MEPPLDSGANQLEAEAEAEGKVNVDPVMDTAHFARFEFSEAGTKVLMVEWTPESALDKGQAERERGETSVPASEPAGWQVSWPGKATGTFLPASEAHVETTTTTVTSTSTPATASAPAPASTKASAPRRRVFFLLPPPTPIPATVTLTPPGGAPSIELKPLPAIFPEGFSAVESRQGTRGVLHTIWAKQRVRELEREMQAEMRANAESVGLDMAMAEKQWIVDTFLHSPSPPHATKSSSSPNVHPVLPRSPTGGRLGEKLKGLRLGTSPIDLAPSPTANTFTLAGSQSQTLSPLGGDIAVSSFASIARPRGLGPSAAPVSLDAALKSDTGVVANQKPADTDEKEAEQEEELFALPMSPRSPEMARSPFSLLR